MNWTWSIREAGIALGIIALALLIGFAAQTAKYHNMKAERDALEERVAELSQWSGDFDVDGEMYQVTFRWGDTSNLSYGIHKSWMPDGKPDTTKKLVRDISGLDTMPVITACTLYVRANQAWNGGVLIPFKGVGKTETPPTK